MFKISFRIDTSSSIVIPDRRPPRVVGVQIGRGTSAQAAESALQRILERFPEVPVEVSVDHRVEGRVEVADPEDHDHDNVGAGAKNRSA